MFRCLISVYLLPSQAVFAACGDTSALCGHSLNRNQPPHAHQVIGRDGEPVEPIHPVQASQLDLAQSRAQFGPAKDPLNELAFTLADYTPRIGSLLRAETVLLQVALHILADVGRHLAFAQRFSLADNPYRHPA